MSRELNILAREFNNKPVTVLRTQMNLYQTNIQSAASAFLKRVEQECKKEKQSTVTLIALIE